MDRKSPVDEGPGRPPLRIPAENRGAILLLTPVAMAFGAWIMATGKIGRGPTPVEGPVAVIVGAVFAGFGAILFAIAWRERGRKGG